MYRSQTNDKIGNLVVYLVDKLGNLPMTKLLKLVYLIDEKSVKETGVPITWFTYKIWKMGPVAESLYMELRKGHGEVEFSGGHHSSYTLSDYISIDHYEDQYTPLQVWVSKKEGVSFDDSEFCDYEIEVLDDIIERYGKMTGNQLIDETHAQDRPWARGVKMHNLYHQFDVEGYGMSDYVLNLHDDSDDELQNSFLEASQMMKFKELIKDNVSRNRQE